MAGNLLISISQDERERAILRSRRMYQTDLQSDLATAEDRGRAEGIAAGLAKGRRAGILSALQSLMERMGLSLDQAMDLLNIPDAERPMYRNILNGQ